MVKGLPAVKETLQPRGVPSVDGETQKVEVAAREQPVLPQARCLLDGAMHPAEVEERLHEPGESEVWAQ